MIPNNLMRFHENNTIITSLKEFTGSYLSIPNTINAPIEKLTIDGASSQIVTVQNKNLFGSVEGANKVVSTINNATYAYKTVVDGRNVLALVGNDILRNKPIFTNFKANTRYTIQCYARRYNSTSTGMFYVKYTDGTWDYFQPYTTVWTKYTFYTSIGKTVQSLSLIYGDVGLAYFDYDTLQLEEGVATAYAPFVPDSPSPNYPATITNVVNPVVTATDTHTSHITNLLGTLRSLPNGVCDKIIIDKSTQTAWIERNIGTVTLASGTSWNIANAKNNSSYRSTNLANGTLTGTTLTSTVTIPTSFEVNYELATPTTESIAYPLLESIQYLTNISTNSALNPIIKAIVRVLGS